MDKGSFRFTQQGQFSQQISFNTVNFDNVQYIENQICYCFSVCN